MSIIGYRQDMSQALMGLATRIYADMAYRYEALREENDSNY